MGFSNPFLTGALWGPKSHGHWLIRHNLDKGFHCRKLCYVRPWYGWDVSDRMIPCMVSPWSAAPPNHAVRSWSALEARLTEILKSTSLRCVYDSQRTCRYELSITRTGLILWFQNVWWENIAIYTWHILKWTVHHDIFTKGSWSMLDLEISEARQNCHWNRHIVTEPKHSTSRWPWRCKTNLKANLNPRYVWPGHSGQAHWSLSGCFLQYSWEISAWPHLLHFDQS